jgi:hypothetical protein
MKSLLLLLALACSAHAFSQFTISGKIFDNTNKPARAVTVLLLKQNDSSLVKSAITNAQGEYSIEQVKQGKYLLKSSMVGFGSDFKTFEVNNSNVSIADIQLSAVSKTLQDVTVVATKPFLEQRADKLIVNVENSATAAGSTALEVLQKVPGVMVINDKIKLAGKNSLSIMIDGRLSQYQDMSQVLRDMSASNIEKIEVITNPGAKYDATGGAIINIILKRNADLGTNGSVSVSGGMGLYDRDGEIPIDRNFYRGSTAVSLNHRKNKWNVYGGYSFFRQNNFTFNRFIREIGGSRFLQSNYSPNNVRSHSYRLGADYYLNKKNTVGFLVRGFNRAGGSETFNNTFQTKISDGQSISNFKTLLDQNSKRANIASNLNWKHTFDTTGRTLNVDIDYANFQIDNSSNIFTTLSNGFQSVNNQVVDNPVEYGVFKLDYTRPFNKETKLEIGGKSSFASIDNFLTFRRNGVVDNQQSNNFLYKENINAAYASFQKKLTDWEFIAGLRTEQTVAQGTSVTGKVLDRNYWQLFPSAFVTRKLNKDFSAVAQYSKRVNRPSYQQQNPFVFYIDSLTYTRGNPLIRPELTDATKLSLTYQGQPFLSLNYNKTYDVIFENAPKQEGNLTYASPENLAKYESYSVELNFPIKFGKKISGYGGNQFIYNKYKAEYLNGIYDNGRFNWMAYGQVVYKPTTTLSIEVSGFYTTRMLEEFLTIEPFGNLNFAIAKTFWEKKGRLTLNLTDAFFSSKTAASIDYQDIKVNFLQRNESRSVRLAFSYAFGNQKLKASRSRSTGSDTESNRVKIN